MSADIIFVFIVKAGENIAPNIGIDIARKDKSSILSYRVSTKK